MTLQDIEKELLALLEQDGPMVLEALVAAVAPQASVTVAALIALGETVAALVQAKSEKEQMIEAEKAIFDAEKLVP